MTLYTVHLPPDAVSAEEVAERSVFVKEGFAFFGFAFTGFWLLAQRLWLEAIAYLGAIALISALFWQFGLPPGAYAGVTFLLSLLIGIEGNEWIRRRLGRAGWTQAGTVSGPSLDECERRFFGEWVASGAAPRSGPPPLRPAPSAGPVGRPVGVLGVFPEPRGQTSRP
jgi:hypothetical protein